MKKWGFILFLLVVSFCHAQNNILTYNGNIATIVPTQPANYLFTSNGTNAGTFQLPQTVTSVGLTMPNWFSVSNSPVTTSGTIAVVTITQPIRQFLRSGSTNQGNISPFFGGIVTTDLPNTIDSGVTILPNSPFQVSMANHILNFSYGSSTNVPFGSLALGSITTGVGNTTLGVLSMANITTGDYNTAIGYEAMGGGTAGQSGCVAIGHYAMHDGEGSDCIAIGDTAGFDFGAGTDNIALGAYTRLKNTNDSNEIMIGDHLKGNGSETVNIGNTNVTAIYAQVTSITGYSDGRIKEHIEKNVLGLKFINALNPVTFYFNPKREDSILGIKYDEHHSRRIRQKKQIGFIAQQVVKAAASCGTTFPGVDIPKDSNSELYTIRTSDIIPALVTAIQELTHKNDSLANEVSSLKHIVSEIQKNQNTQFYPFTNQHNHVTALKPKE
jgi:Chaperone of endosialidase